MFSSKKKESKPPRNRGERSNDMANMLGIGMDFNMGDNGGFGVEEDDDDLEAELAALQGKAPKKKGDKKKQKTMTLGEIDQLVAVSTKDIDVEHDDDELDDEDFDDADLMSELAGIADDEPAFSRTPEEPQQIPDKQSVSPVPTANSSTVLDTLLERQKVYQAAIKNADSSKARRLGRGLKQIEDQIKAAKAGWHVDPDDIPPMVAVGGPKPPSQTQDSPAQPAPSAVPPPQEAQEPLIDLSSAEEPEKKTTKDSTSNKDKEKQASLLKLLKFRQDQYKLAARNHHKAGHTDQAKEFLMVVKQFDAAMEAVQEGQLFDESEVPAAPPLHPTEAPVPPQAAPTAQPPLDPEPVETGGPPIPSNTLEGLQQRLEKYNTATQQATQEGNSSKARRMGRIVQQYEDAIKMVKAGKIIDLEELPAPPGYPPIPPQGAKPAPSPQPPAASPQAPKTTAPAAPKPSSKAQVPPVNVQLGGRAGQQLEVLQERYKEFKAAALAAKKANKIEQAKDYLRTAKGLEGMIAAAEGGVRVDLSQVPPSPAPPKTPEVAADDQDLWGTTTAVSLDPEQRAEIFKTLQESLTSQYQICNKNADHFAKIGDIASSQSFQRMAQHCKNDLITIKNANLHGDPPPKFHYEDKSFTIVRTNTELSTSEAEVEIIRGIDLPIPKGYSPKDLYLYVSYEFPFPSENCPTGSTQVVKHTVNPEFKEKFKHPIDRKSRALGRVVKRQGIKLEVKYQRGFLQSDKCLGQATLKFATLENKSEVHEVLELLDADKGRRPVGGKIEAKVRLREPLVDKDVEILKENWLVIDAFVKSRSNSGPTLGQIQSTECKGRDANKSDEEFISLEVLRLEYQLALKQVSVLKEKGKTVDPSLVQQCKILQAKMGRSQELLDKADRAIIKNYIAKVQESIPLEHKKAQSYAKSGNKADAQLCLLKKKAMENEVASLKQKYGFT